MVKSKKEFDKSKWASFPTLFIESFIGLISSLILFFPAPVMDPPAFNYKAFLLFIGISELFFVAFCKFYKRSKRTKFGSHVIDMKFASVVHSSIFTPASCLSYNLFKNLDFQTVAKNIIDFLTPVAIFIFWLIVYLIIIIGGIIIFYYINYKIAMFFGLHKDCGGRTKNGKKKEGKKRER